MSAPELEAASAEGALACLLALASEAAAGVRCCEAADGTLAWLVSDSNGTSDSPGLATNGLYAVLPAAEATGSTD